MIEQLHTHLRDVETIQNAGGKVTEEWERLRERWYLFATLDEAPASLVLDTITGDGDVAEMSLARTVAALSDPAFLTARAAVSNQAAAGVAALLRTEYAKTATANYETIGAAFNAKAEHLTALVAKVEDPYISTDALLRQPKATQSAWLDLANAAADLDAAIVPLRTAAGMARLLPRRHTGRIDMLDLALTVDTADLHRRRVWAAWDNTSAHGGRWAALVLLGATLRAHQSGKVTAYREPRPMEKRPMPGSIRGSFRMEEYDPEDPAELLLEADAAE